MVGAAETSNTLDGEGPPAMDERKGEASAAESANGETLNLWRVTAESIAAVV
nr:hypothetical protein [Tanacetum cinerariifolium]